MTVDTCIDCQTCINRMFNSGNKIEIGIGNITSDIVIILPMLSSKKNRNKILDDVKAMWEDITGKNILEECYITYHIKCPKHTSYDTSNAAVSCCNKILNKELLRVPYRYMIMFNTASIVLQNVQFNNDIFVYNNKSFFRLNFSYKTYNEASTKQDIKIKLCNIIKQINHDKLYKI